MYVAFLLLYQIEQINIYGRTFKHLTKHIARNQRDDRSLKMAPSRR